MGLQQKVEFAATHEATGDATADQQAFQLTMSTTLHANAALGRLRETVSLEAF